MPYYVGIDIGGTKTAVGIFSEDFQPFKTDTMLTRPEEGCRNLVRRIGDSYRRLLCETGLNESAVASVGVVCPGPLDLERGKIVYIPTMGFYDEPLVQYFQEELMRPVALENDTNAAALCESVFGQGKDCAMVAYITISTGVGCGLAYHRKIVDGKAFAAGELGHIKVVRDGKPCPCGGHGCLEAYASGTAIASIASQIACRTMDAKEVFSLARQGHQPEISVVKEAADHLGYAIATLYQILDPDIVVLGGSVTRDYDVFRDDLEAAVSRYVQPVPGRNYCLSVSQYDGKQVLLGAAYYGSQKQM